MEEKELFPIQAERSRDEICVTDRDAVEWLDSRGYGFRFGDNLLVLRPFEALYLMSQDKLALYQKHRQLSFHEYLRLSEKEDVDIWLKYLIYKDLRDKGYVVKDGYGFGIDFKVYEAGEYGSKPAKYLVYGVVEGVPLPVTKLYNILKHAYSLRKTLIIATVDRRSEIVYYMLSSLLMGKETRGE
ncbi:MAG: tRNA-intron lyase [Candidatus Brockarchaeota archaeon]|nr:tRNA-intron lyase [Candidatus Brockarchaeota archaeon]